ncbi:MAG: deoxynucleoside kinase, partial [Chloroflexota bacterium]
GVSFHLLGQHMTNHTPSQDARLTSYQRDVFVAVAGNIGAGKSSLTGLLAEAFDWAPFYEANAENPYLEDFYEDMERWSFHSQVFFLGKRLEHHRRLIDHPGSVVQDRTVYEDAEIFACNLYEQGKMSDRDYNAYRSLYQAVSAFLPPPDLIVYLRASTPTLLRHIEKRGRNFEQNIDPNYVDRLSRLYDRWIDAWTASPVLVIDMNAVDFIANPDDLAAIIEQVDLQLGML